MLPVLCECIVRSFQTSGNQEAINNIQGKHSQERAKKGGRGRGREREGERERESRRRGRTERESYSRKQGRKAENMPTDR